MMPVRRRLLFNLFTLNSISHINYGMWTHPEDKSLEHNDLGRWVDLAILAERGCMDSIFLADTFGLGGQYRGSTDIFIERGILFPTGDPSMMLSAMCYATEHLGFVYTSSIIQQHPFNFARTVSTIDHLSKGRVGWNVVTSYTSNGYRNAGFDELLDHDDRYRWAEEYLSVVYQLWEGSWEDGAITADAKRGVFADPSKIHTIDHRGERYKVGGPHTVEPSPQRTPVLFQAGSSEVGRDFAARHAEGVFIMADSPQSAEVAIQDGRARAVKAGRRPDDVQFIQGLSIVVGSTMDEACQRAADYDSSIDAEAVLAQRGGALGIDLASADPDTPLADVLQSAQGIHGPARFFMESQPAGSTPTVGDLARSFAGKLRVVGTPESIADSLAEWGEAGVDGFNIYATVNPGTFVDFVDHVVPVLQSRGLMQKEYAAGTLREKSFPASGPLINDRHPAHLHRRS